MDESEEFQDALQRLNSGRPLNSRHLSLLLKKPSGIVALQGCCKLKSPKCSSKATDIVNSLERAELSTTQEGNSNA